jgi:hypothetical protein
MIVFDLIMQPQHNYRGNGWVGKSSFASNSRICCDLLQFDVSSLGSQSHWQGEYISHSLF